jgi:hypothetical protein
VLVRRNVADSMQAYVPPQGCPMRLGAADSGDRRRDTGGPLRGWRRGRLL